MSPKEISMRPFDYHVSGPMEMQEYLFANTEAQRVSSQFHSGASYNGGDHRTNLRTLFRLHRFSVINWLLMQGVSIPAELLADQTHPEVGKMLPDNPAVFAPGK